MGGFFFNATSLTFQGFPSRTSEFIYMSCPKGKERLLFTISFSPFTAYSLPCAPLFQQQLWNFYDCLTKVSKKSFGNNLSWVSPLKSCGSSANTSASNKGRCLWGVKWPNGFLSLSVLLNFFLFFFPFPSLSHELTSFVFLILKRKSYPLVLITFLGSLCEVWARFHMPVLSAQKILSEAILERSPVSCKVTAMCLDIFGGKNSKAICVFANCKACAE